MAPGNRKAPKRSTASESQYSLVEFMADFPDDETCLRWLWNTRYNLGDTTAHCTRCGEIRTFRRYTAKQQRQDWTCTACGLHVHPTAGTIFHKSSTSLHLWFYAMYLMTSTRCGISAKQLERELGVTYKTAWRMSTLIRNELMAPEDTALSGTVEMDETFVGGKPRQSDRAKWPKDVSRQSAAKQWSADKKVPIFGMVERNRVRMLHDDDRPVVTRHGQVAAYVVPSVQAATVQPHIAQHVEPGSVLMTDEGMAYTRLRENGWDHHTIQHKEKVYVRGSIHTQTIDGFWALVKRGITGTHHAVSRKWLQGYVNEYVWRYNRRGDAKSLFAQLILRSAFPVSG
jgi:transposase